MSERKWTQGTHGRCNVVSFDGEEIRPVATFVLVEEAELACRLQSENAALRAQVERLEAEKLRLREVVVNAKQCNDDCPCCYSYGECAPSCQLAAVLRETEADTETGRE